MAEDSARVFNIYFGSRRIPRHMWRAISNNYRGFGEERGWAASGNGLQCSGSGEPVSRPRYNTTIAESSPGQTWRCLDLTVSGWFNWAAPLWCLCWCHPGAPCWPCLVPGWCCSLCWLVRLAEAGPRCLARVLSLSSLWPRSEHLPWPDSGPGSDSPAPATIRYQSVAVVSVGSEGRVWRSVTLWQWHCSHPWHATAPVTPGHHDTTPPCHAGHALESHFCIFSTLWASLSLPVIEIVMVRSWSQTILNIMAQDISKSDWLICHNELGASPWPEAGRLS